MASFLDSITNVFTGAPGKEAAEQQQAFIRQQQAATDAALAQARTGGLEALRSGRESALGYIPGAVATARGDISGAIDPRIQALMAGQTGGLGALYGAQDPALAALQGGVATAQGAYAPLQAAAERYGAAGGGASQASADALGLNGPEGTARAQANFTAGPGYQFQLGQGIDALTRAANVGGSAAGGNVLAEAQKYGSGLAAQEFDKYRQALAQREGLYTGAEAGALGQAGAGISQAGLTGGTGAAGVLTGTGARASDVYGAGGRSISDVYGGAGQSLADIAMKGGLTSAQIAQLGGQNEADLLARLAQTGATFGAATLTPFNNASQYGANMEMLGSKNLWDFGMNAAKGLAGAGLFGGGGSASLPFGNPGGGGAYTPNPNNPWG